MPATVQVKVVAARDLPIMDRSSELTDAFVELRLGHSFEKTDVCAKTLSPVWDSKWFTFRTDEEDLQEEPLQVRVMDHDTYSSHNAIGRVYVPLTTPSVSGAATQHSGHIDGWFPIYDTLHGIRGEVRLMVKVDILKDQHRFRQSSYGIMFFVCPQTPSCYTTKAIHGFVEELVVNDDPEYKWIDRIRTPRASNEARQLLFSKLTGELQRKIGLKALEVGGNAVIGYQQCFDLEGDTGIVVRGIGTCVSLVPRQASAGIGPGTVPSVLLPANIHGGLLAGKGPGHLEEYLEPSVDMMSPKPRVLNRKTSSSDSDGPSSPARAAGSGLTMMSHHGELGSAGSSHPLAGIKPVPSTSDFPFYTLTSLPPGVLTHLGGVVSSRSVKLLDKIKDPDEPETRDAWWQEVRNEVKAHAQAYGCNAILGYSESISICDTLCILSASGTAVCIASPAMQQRKQISPGSSVDERDMELKESGSCLYPQCSVCHVPYSPAKLPFDGQLTNCAICSSHLVPSVILSTAEPPDTPIRGRGTLIQVRVVLPKPRKKGEENAIFVSKQLPFLEYRLYTRLLNKARVKGMNSVFCLQIQYTIGDTIIIGVATGTSLYLEALPPPCKLSISDKEKSSNAKQLVSIQEALNRSQESNVLEYGLSQPLDIPKTTLNDTVISEEEKVPLDLSLNLGGQEAFVFDVEDHVLKEEDIMELILDRPLPKGFHATNTHLVPGIHPSSLTSDFKMIAMVTKKSLEPGKQHLEKQCTQLFGDLHQALAFKVRRSGPCLVTRIRYDLDLPEDDMLQIAITAMVTRMKAPSGSGNVHNSHSGSAHNPLPFICGSSVEQYLRIINFFVIRESTSIRESGGLDSFMHLFTLEALAIARAHVAALGGNALLNFRLNDCVLIEHPHKNQAQCLLNVSGDAAVLSAAPPHCQLSTSTVATSITTSVTTNATLSIGQSALGTQSPPRTKTTSVIAPATTSDGKLTTPSQIRISLPTLGKKKGDKGD